MLTCDMCGGTMSLMGRLGDLDHFRCVDCGAEGAVPATDEHEHVRDEVEHLTCFSCSTVVTS